jgi:hypothetical protein
MARKRQATANPRQSTPDFQIPREEQLRLIEQTGILNKDSDPKLRASFGSTTPRTSGENDGDEEEYPLAEEIFAATTLLVPISFLLLMMYM